MVKRGPKPKGKIKLEWSPELVYAVGLITADGSLSKNGRHIDFTSKDLDQIKTYCKCLGIEDIKIGTKLVDLLTSIIGSPSRWIPRWRLSVKISDRTLTGAYIFGQRFRMELRVNQFVSYPGTSIPDTAATPNIMTRAERSRMNCLRATISISQNLPQIIIGSAYLPVRTGEPSSRESATGTSRIARG